jgi:hypothetical protein
MRPLTTPELLDAWEAGVPQPASQRALTLLAAACPEATVEEFSRLPVGQRDGLLLSVREQTFGSRLPCLITCAACGERAEVAFHVADLRVEPRSTAPGVLTIEAQGYLVEFRLPDTLDLFHLATASLERARRALLERCLLTALKDGMPISVVEVPDEVAREISTEMERVDGQACVELVTTCPGCGSARTSALDIGAFFWSEVDAWAQRTLRDVHALASAYHWSEADILTMSPWKRRIYLDMVTG